MTVLVFANGDIADVDWIRPYLTQATAIIAADGGMRHLLALDWAPDVLIGDMDSLPQGVVASPETAVITHPPAKDETDLELALIHAAATYDEDILIFGAFGGRLDQMLANILLLAHPRLQDRQVQLVNRFERAWLVTAVTHIHGQTGDTVSLIPLGGDVHVQSTAGLRWPLPDERLSFGPARGVSNVMTADLATITVRSGQLLCIHTQQSWQR